ncbi:MAG: hypothetical protein V4773_02160 [Verrucomicrobiota bacterium]
MRPQYQPYRSRHPNPGIVRYALGPDYILIEFRSGDRYRYDHTAPGRSDVQSMKKLAASGTGLTTFINQNVRDNYSAKLAH